MNIILILGLLSVFFKKGYPLQFSCSNARNIYKGSNSFCPMVSWKSATLFNSTSQTAVYYTPKSTAFLSQSSQDEYAKQIDTSIHQLNTVKSSSLCINAIARFSCVSAFPVCPSDVVNQAVSYFKPCRLHCTQIQKLCHLSSIRSKYPPTDSALDLDCDSFPEENCVLNLPAGYFAISPSEGPTYLLGPFYLTLLVCWVFMALYWNYAVYFVYTNRCATVCRLVSAVPILKVIVMTLGTAFWYTCNQWDMCSFWLSVGLINLHLCYETAILVSFLLVARGWSITRDSISPSDWRIVVVSMSCFYMANSIVLVLQAASTSSSVSMLSSAVLYGCMYLLILKFSVSETQRALDHVTYLRADIPAHIATPVRLKRDMYIVFSVATALAMFAEALTQAIVFSGGAITPVLLCYEFSNFAFVLVVGFYFRPTQYSPFFFMEPILSNDAEQNPLIATLVKSVDDPEVQFELEISSLISSNASERLRQIQTQERESSQRADDGDSQQNSLWSLTEMIRAPGARMIVVRNPREEMAIGMSHGGGANQSQIQHQPQEKMSTTSNASRRSSRMENQANMDIGTTTDTALRIQSSAGRIIGRSNARFERLQYSL